MMVRMAHLIARMMRATACHHRPSWTMIWTAWSIRLMREIFSGNLWKFNLSSSNINDWDVAYKADDGTKMPLFQAKNLSGFRQPITTTPDVMNHCDFNRRGNIVVFGTGRYLGMDDYLTYSSVETIYEFLGLG